MDTMMLVLEALYLTTQQYPVVMTIIAATLCWYAVKHISEWVVTIKWLYPHLSWHPHGTHVHHLSSTITRYTPHDTIRTSMIRLLWRRHIRNSIVAHDTHWDSTIK